MNPETKSTSLKHRELMWKLNNIFRLAVSFSMVITLEMNLTKKEVLTRFKGFFILWLRELDCLCFVQVLFFFCLISLFG